MGRIVPWVASMLVLVTARDLGTTRLEVPGPPGGHVEIQLPARAHQSWVHGSYTMCLNRTGR